MSAALLDLVGARVRSLRGELGFSRRVLAERSGLSERFLAQLERGEGNISLLRFADVAAALGTTPAVLLEVVPPRGASIAFLGVRGAGKSSVGRAVADKMSRRFVEIDQSIEAAAGLSLAEIFELHGEAYYRRLEREVLSRLLLADEPLVLATGGSIINHADNWRLLAGRATTVWLRAAAEDHWERVIRQGDRRPMAKNPHAFSELRALIAAREPLYARADITVDTSSRSVAGVVASVVKELKLHGQRGAPE